MYFDLKVPNKELLPQDMSAWTVTVTALMTTGVMGLGKQVISTL